VQEKYKIRGGIKKGVRASARNKKIRAMKISPNAQAVFNLEYDEAKTRSKTVGSVRGAI
jgi:hypothetical protein